MSERTFGQKVGQWLSNLTVMIPLLSTLGLSSIYGNSDTVKRLVNDFLFTADGTPIVTPDNRDKVLTDLIEANKKRDIKINKLENDIKEWHE